MVNERKIYAIEFTAIILLWTFAVIFPLLFIDDFDNGMRTVHVMWSECIVVGFVFLVNRFLLMPSLFFAKKYIAYITSIVGALILLGIFIVYFDGVNIFVSIFEGYNNVSAMVSHDMSPPPVSMSPHTGFAPHDMPPPPVSMSSHTEFAPHDMPPRATLPSVQLIPPMIFVLIASIIVIALDLGVRIAATWIISEQKQAEINRERVTAQLQNLQSQVSPHFFMNTLNNIHALVDIDSQRAKQTIIELSSLMSYILYESSTKETVPLQRELDFISNYVNLMHLRFSKQIKVVFSYDDNVPAINIPPLLFLNFIENAFKYGVDNDQESIIKISFSFSDTTIEMNAINNNHSSSVKSRRKGLGITNSRKRLDLLYGDSYTLYINNNEKVYYVNLKIPIQ